VASLDMLHMRGGYLYEHRPDVIPQGFVTDEELSLWAAYYELRAARTDRRK
jgi:hypothetical protein